MLEANQIHCGYGQTLVLKGLSLKVREGQFVGIIGPNGSGKTTFLRAVTKVIPLKTGDIQVGGRSVAQLSPSQLARIVGVVSQNQETVFSLRVEEFVLMGRIPYLRSWQWMEGTQDRQEVEEALRLTGILPLRYRLLQELSAGERQLVFIARALAQKPKLLLMDEPTAHLDLQHRIQIFRLLHSLVDRFGITALCILHDLNLAAQFCPCLVMFSSGRVAFQGPPEEVITREHISTIYGIDTMVITHPVNRRPQVVYPPL